MRKWQVLHIAIISNFKTLLKVSFEKCSKLTRVDRPGSPEGVSLGQKCSNMSAQITLHVNICNQYVIYLITQLIWHFLSDRPQLSTRTSMSGHCGWNRSWDGYERYYADVTIVISTLTLKKNASINYVRRPAVSSGPLNCSVSRAIWNCMVLFFPDVLHFFTPGNLVPYGPCSGCGNFYDSVSPGLGLEPALGVTLGWKSAYYAKLDCWLQRVFVKTLWRSTLLFGDRSEHENTVLLSRLSWIIIKWYN